MRAGRTSGSGAQRHAPRSPTRSHEPDSSGFSYVEVLVAIVLVGMVVIAILVGLQTTVISGRVGTERSQLLQWANEGVEALHRDPVACSAANPNGMMTTSEATAIRDSYQATLNAVLPPDGMSGGTLVVAAPEFLSIDRPSSPGDPATFTERWDDRMCDPDFSVAALRITARSPEGTTVDVEVFVDG